VKFSQKKTCAGCKIEKDDWCTVKKKPLYPDHDLGVWMGKRPTEPCFKPKTNSDYIKWHEEYEKIQIIELKILRANSSKPNADID
jgi:hypothetical protein